MSAYATNDLIDFGDNWLMLYTAGNIKHNRELPPGVEKPWRGVLAASAPKGRFAALAATPRTVGRLTLKPFIPTEGAIAVDSNVRGSLRAELRDPFGAPIPGFEMDSAVPIQGDSAAHTLQWDGGKTALPYQFDAVSLRIEMDDGELFGITA